MKKMLPGCVLRWMVLALGVGCAAPGFAAQIGQTDDFQDGSTMGWRWGKEIGTVNMPGGPGGASDRYLENNSLGGDDEPGAKMAVINGEPFAPAQWTGDFLAAGITTIELDAANLGPNPAFDDIYLRLAFSSDTATIGSGRVYTTTVYHLGRGTGWQNLVFPITVGSLTAVAGSDVAEVMASVSQTRIISSQTGDFRGDRIQARLGVDNITAVPEPAGWSLLLGTGLLATGCLMASKRRRLCRQPVRRR